MTNGKTEEVDVKLPIWDSDAFAARLIESVKGKRPYSLERETGIAESLIRKYMDGKSIPGSDKLAILAKVAGVSLDWLATGEGKRAAAEPNADHQLNLTVLEQVVSMIRKAEDSHQVRLSGIATARVIRMLYGWCVDNAIQVSQSVVDDVVDAQSGADKWED